MPPPSSTHISRPGPIRRVAKAVVRRVMRPGVWDIEQRLDRIERQLRPRHWPVAIWKGGLKDGCAVGPDGSIDPAMTRKYRGELRYWVGVSRGTDPNFPGNFEETFGTWQHTRSRELADRLGNDPGDEMDRWCARRRVVEIGGGPYPACSVRPWASAVAVDPLAEGYVRERLVPAGANHVVHLSATGESIPLPAASADVLIIENCLDHVERPARVAAEIARLLSPGGYLWLLVDVMEHRDHMHPNPMNRQRVHDLFSPHGFSFLFDEIWDCKSHPMATGQLRALLQLPQEGSPDPARESATGAGHV